MIYPYKCPQCSRYEEVVRPASEYSLPAICPDCSSIMDRIWTPTPGRLDMIKNRPPKGAVEIGNERLPAKKQGVDYDAGLRAELNSGRYPELAGLSA